MVWAQSNLIGLDQSTSAMLSCLNSVDCRRVVLVKAGYSGVPGLIYKMVYIYIYTHSYDTTFGYNAEITICIILQKFLNPFACSKRDMFSAQTRQQYSPVIRGRGDFKYHVFKCFHYSLAPIRKSCVPHNLCLPPNFLGHVSWIGRYSLYKYSRVHTTSRKLWSIIFYSFNFLFPCQLGGVVITVYLAGN